MDDLGHAIIQSFVAVDQLQDLLLVSGFSLVPLLPAFQPLFLLQPGLLFLLVEHLLKLCILLLDDFYLL